MDRRRAIAAALTLAAAESVRAQDQAKAAAGAATALERAAKVTIIRDAFAPGDVRRYGALGDGSADDSAAWRAALSTGHRVLGGGYGQVYRLDQNVPVTRATVIDFEGATVRPRGATFAFVRTPPPPTVSATVLRGATQGSRALMMDRTVGFRVGQWARLIFNDYPTHDPSSYPPSWTHIAAVRPEAIELDTPLQVTYALGPPLTLVAYDPGALVERFECRNGIFDGSESTNDAGTGQALRIGGAERVAVQSCEFRDFRNAGQYTCAVELFTNVDALLSDCRFTGSVSRFDICDIQESRFAHFVNNQLDGSHFGCNITRVDSGLFANNSLQGRRAFEAAIGPTVRSVRGLKAYGCAAIRILGNHLADYESPIKVEACFRYDISHNTIFNGGLSPYSGQIALNVGSIAPGTNMRDGRIIGNHVECCGGIGIGVETDSPGGVCVSGNIVRATQGRAININVPNAIVSGNRIEDWGLRNAGDAALQINGSASIVDNRFANASLSALPCIVTTGATAHLVMRDNVSESGNRLS